MSEMEQQSPQAERAAWLKYFPAGLSWGPLLNSGKAAAGLAVLSIVPLFIVFANTQIKELFDRFTGGCVFVLEKERTSNGQLLVTGRIAGTMPKSIPLVFEGQDALINTILIDEPYRQENIPEPDDLAFHPLTGLSCPGALCEDSTSTDIRRSVQIVLTDLRPEFVYRFQVRLRPDAGAHAVSTQNLKTYAIFDSGLSSGVCLVQPRRWFNFWVWATPIQKALLFIGMIVFGGLIVKGVKSTGG